MTSDLWFYLAVFLAFLVGSMLGSFLNVVGLRLLKEESIIYPPSHCPLCQEPIAWKDNLPIISWLMLNGRCRHCKGPISIQYPLIEALMGLLTAGLVVHYSATVQTLLLFILVADLVVVIITDLREQYIYDINSLGLIPIGLLYSALNFAHTPIKTLFTLGSFSLSVPESLISAVIAVVGAFIVFFVLNLISLLLLGKEGFGEGDTRLLMGMGAFFGVSWMIFIFIAAFILQAVVAIPYLMVQWWRQKAYHVMAYMGGAFMLVAIPYVAQLWMKNSPWLLLLVMPLGLIAMVLAFRGLKLAKELPKGLTYLPFGPALVVACWGVVYFSNTLWHWVYTLTGIRL